MTHLSRINITRVVCHNNKYIRNDNNSNQFYYETLISIIIVFYFLQKIVTIRVPKLDSGVNGVNTACMYCIALFIIRTRS